MRHTISNLILGSSASPRTLEALDARVLPAADLSVAIVNTISTYVVPGDKIKFTANVTNTGTTIINGPVTVNFIAPVNNTDSPLGVAASITKNLSLKPGQSAQVVAPWTVTDAAAPGVYDYAASLQPSAQTGDTSNDTSTRSAGFDLKLVFGSYGARRNVVLSTVDDDGTIITYSMNGPGYGLFRAANTVDQQAGLDVMGTSTASQMSILLKGGNSLANLDQTINIAGSLGKLVAAGCNFSGTLSVSGSLGDFTAGDLTDLDMTIAGRGPGMKFKAGNITDLRLNSNTPIAQMDFGDWQWVADPSRPDLTDTQLSTLTAPWIGKLTARGEFSAITSLSGVGAPGGTTAMQIKIGGTFTGQFSANGTIAAFAATTVDQGMIVCSGSLFTATIGNAIDASIWARSLLKLDLGTAANIDVAAGATFDATALSALAQGNRAVIGWGAGSIGAITAKGNITRGHFAAGVNPTDGIVLNGDDVQTATGAIGKIELKGTTGDVLFAASSLPAIAKIGALSVRTATDGRFILLTNPSA
jgi:hypothetical protein